MKKNEIVEANHSTVENISTEIQIGQWFWVKSERENSTYENSDSPITNAWLGCVVAIGSNYVEIRSPDDNRGCVSVRVLLKNLLTHVEYEPNSKQVIAKIIGNYNNLSNSLMGKVIEISKRLGISKQTLITQNDGSSNNALTVINEGNKNADTYKNELIEAKEKTLPELFEKVKRSNEKVAKWMKAESLPLTAHMNLLHGSLAVIDDRIFNVSIYTGLTEDVVLVKDGEPADFHEKISVMQRRLYMDEECLLDYDVGGMDFKKIGEFDQWIAREHNFKRILPHNKCVTALKVRRNKKHREYRGIGDSIINIRLEQEDRLTFLYIRNGEKLYRVQTEVEFDEMLFPTDMVGFNEPQMVQMCGIKPRYFMPVREYDVLVAEAKKQDAIVEKWFLDNPEKEWIEKNNNDKNVSGHSNWNWANPNRRHSFHAFNWDLVSHDHLYFDEIKKELDDKAKKFNRIALILQGLLDRSDTLHPHPKIQLSDANDFTNMITLQYDAEMVLTHGEPPSFEDYRAKCNSQITADSVFYGQHEIWVEHETDKERDRLASRGYGENELWNSTPEGNEGMGILAKPFKITRTGKAVFSWYRRMVSSKNYGKKARCTHTVPLECLFNISAYKKGDYKQFFYDPRTREKYLEWSPILLLAEDFVSGKALAQMPNSEKENKFAHLWDI